MAEPLRHPGVRFPPPILFVLGALIGWQLHRMYPLPIVASGRTALTSGLGWFALAAGFLFSAWGFLHLPARRHRDRASLAGDTNRRQRSLSILEESDVLGLAIMLIGGSILANNLWMLLTLPLALLLLYRFVIRREEAYLISAFPAEYGAYRSRVRRFI